MKLLVAVMLLSFSSFAEERPWGVVTTTDAGSGASAVFNITARDAGFAIPPHAFITVQPNVNSYVCVDSHLLNKGVVTCSSTTGVLVEAGEKFPSSCAPLGQAWARPFVKEYLTLADGGLPTDGGLADGGNAIPTVAFDQESCSVACVPAVGASANCSVWVRRGDESRTGTPRRYGVSIATSTRLEIISCASGGSADAGTGLGNTLAAGTYLLRVTNEDTWICYAATCASGGEVFPKGTLMLVTFTASQAVSCHSTGSTGTVTFTATGS